MIYYVIYGASDIQNKPSLIKPTNIAQIIHKRKHATLGYFISSKYDEVPKPLIEKIDMGRKVEINK